MASTLLPLVQRSKPVLVTPAEPTPYEFKNLSDIDDQESLRFQIPVVQYYKNEPKMKGKDPAKTIREALAKALVFYYPVAGRLREGPGRKLIVECTAEGVPFVEAVADVRLEELGDTLYPPIPWLEQILYHDEEFDGIIGCPVVLIQVTRLACGGFILASRFNHTMFDAFGMVQFLTAVGEIARNVSSAPTTMPVWNRELLSARNPPQIPHAHQEFDEIPHTLRTPFPPHNLAEQSFFFSAKEIANLKQNHLPLHLQNSTSRFEIITAAIWRSRTLALCLDPDEEVRLMFNINIRGRSNIVSSSIPAGYYGNAFVYPAIVSTAGQLYRNPLRYAVELIKEAKAKATDDYIKSMADLMAVKGRPPFTMIGAHRTCFVSDNTRTGFDGVEYGWGRAVYGGPGVGGFQTIPGVLSYFVPFKNKTVGEDGIVVPLCLPAEAMARLVAELKSLMTNNVP